MDQKRLRLICFEEAVVIVVVAVVVKVVLLVVVIVEVVVVSNHQLHIKKNASHTRDTVAIESMIPR